MPPAAGTIFAPQGVQPNAKTPTVQEWNFTIEQQLSHDTVLRVAYVGRIRISRLVERRSQRHSAADLLQLGGLFGGRRTSATGSIVPQGTLYIPGPNATLPNPELGAGFFWYTEGNSSYNALQVDVIHRFSKGLQFRANYTWSKDLDMNSALTGAQASNQAQMVLDPYDLHRDWGPSAYNIPNSASISGTYDLPFGKGQAWANNFGGFGNRLVSGWQFNTIVSLESGFPFTPQIGSNQSGDGDTRNPDRPSLNPAFSGPVVLGNPNQWFNPNAFVLPTAGTYGNLGRGVYSGPGLADCGRLAVQDHRHHRANQSAISRRVFQRAEPRELRDAQCHGVFQRRHQPLGGLDHDHGYNVAADPIRTEADFLRIQKSKFRIQKPEFPPSGVSRRMLLSPSSHPASASRSGDALKTI